MSTDNDDVKIVIAAHKQCVLPTDRIYLPVRVGAALHRGDVADVAADTADFEGYVPDDTGDNISAKNPYYCELTALYWAWKNLPETTRYIGLVHYRRYFGRRGTKEEPFKKVMSGDDFEEIIRNNKDVKVIVPKKRRYYIETLGSHYAHTHGEEHLETTRAVIREICPEYEGAYDRVLRQTSGHMFNMLIMDRATLDSYLNWLFPILDELYKRTDSADLSAFDARFTGRVAEILLNVWLDFAVNIGNISRHSIVEYDYCEMGRVNMHKKAAAFLRAKFTGRRYEGSF